ncbi:MAG: UPF0489 family protein [Candidatus Margulisbacteria bacterium]|jgi:hypothetical protein|nr:UPF0489 family protein [Candidatus Margulisiibacteriota bacterium]
MIIPKASLGHADFRPYAAARKFAQVYQVDITLARLINRYSVEPGNLEHCKPLVVGGQEDLNPGQLARLEQSYLFQANNTPHYLLEHHGLAEYACAEAREFGVLAEQDCTLVRFDAHPDSDRWRFFKGWDLERIFSSCCPSVNEGSYLRPLIEGQLVSRIVWFRSSPGMMFMNRDIRQDLGRDFPKLEILEIEPAKVADFNLASIDSLPPNKLILDIDLDYFAHLQFEFMYSIANRIIGLHHRAGLALQVLSPGYIDKDKAANFAVDLIRAA